METTHRTDARTVCGIFFWLLALFFLVIGAKSVLGIAAMIDAPATINEGELLSVTFGSDDPGATYELHKNGAYVTNIAPYEWQTTTDDAGLYAFTVYALGTNGTDNATVDVEILDVPLSITINEPAEDTYASNTIPLSVTPNGEVEFCYYVIGAESNTLDKDGNNHVGEALLQDGVYQIVFKCKQGAEVAEAPKDILVDTTPPDTIHASPEQGTQLTDTSVELRITTDEVASCVAWPATGSEENAEAMTTNDWLTHVLMVTLDDGAHNYYARCEDIHGNEQTAPHQFSFSVDELPSAKIEISGKEVLRAGTYDIELTTSEPVQDTPSLTYSYQGGGSGTIALTKQSSTKWEGYIVIGTNEGEKVGSFSFTGKDMSGNTATAISEGSIFRVDTVAPTVVEALKAESSSDHITLEWYYDDDQEEVDFKVFRSEDARVTVGDEVSEVDNQEYHDFSVLGAIEYYYSVAAVDKAGNIGPLAQPVLGAAVPQQVKEEEAPVIASQAFEAEQLSDRVERVIFDIDAAYKLFETERDEQKVIIIRETGLLEQLAQRKVELRNVQRELTTIADTRLTPEKFRERIVAINELLTNTYGIIPKRMQIQSSLSFQQPSDTSVQNMLFSKATALFDPKTGLEEVAVRNAYQEEVQKFMDNAVITGSIISATITYADKEEKGFTYLKKELSFTSRPDAITVLEYLPKEYAQDVDDVSFTPAPVIVERDPIVQYTIPAGTSTFSFSYLIKDSRDLATARSVRSVLFPTPLVPEGGGEGNDITGHTIISIPGFEFLKQYWLYLLGGLIIAGLLVYYFAIDSAPLPPPGYAYGLGNNTGAAQMAVAPPSQASMSVFLNALTQYMHKQAPVAPSGNGALGGSRPFFTRRSPFFQRKPVLARSPLERSVHSPSRPSGAPAASSIIDQPSSAIEELALEPLTQMILEAHQAIDNKEYIEAKRLYDKILPQFDGLMRVDDKDRAATNLLYYKLLLFRKMRSAVATAEAGDRVRLERLLDELRDIAGKLPETESHLVTSAKDQYQELFRVANRLAIEQEDL